MTVAGPAVLLVALAGVYWVLLRRPSAGARRRRGLFGLDQRRRWDGDPLDRMGEVGVLVLVVLAAADALEVVDGGGVVTAVLVGAALALATTLGRAAREVVFVAVGLTALVASVRALVLGEGCGPGLGDAHQVLVMAVATGFLVLLAVFRLVFAPFRARAGQAGAATLLLYAVIQSTVLGLELTSLGAFDRWGAGAALVAAALLAVVAFGGAVQPYFAASAVGVGLAVVGLVLGTAASCWDGGMVVGLLVGLVPVLVVARRLGRR